MSIIAGKNNKISRPHQLSSNKKIISAGIIIFRRTSEGHKFLLLYHGRNYWNFPKGKLEASERSWQAALREVKEETGLKQTELKFVENFKAYERFFLSRGKEKVLKIVILYLAETRQPNITVSFEHEGYAWFTFAEARKVLAHYPDNIKILTTAYDFLRKGSPRPKQHSIPPLRPKSA